jgi:hypothetical protein
MRMFAYISDTEDFSTCAELRSLPYELTEKRKLYANRSVLSKYESLFWHRRMCTRTFLLLEDPRIFCVRVIEVSVSCQCSVIEVYLPKVHIFVLPLLKVRVACGKFVVAHVPSRPRAQVCVTV